MTTESFAGDAIVTTITADLGIGAASIGIAANDGWASGAGAHPFTVEVRDSTNHEKMLVTRSGTTLTILTRAWDETVEHSFLSGATIEHVLSASAMQQTADHMDGTETDPHGTKLLNDERHADKTLHQFGTGSGHALGSPAAPRDIAVAEDDGSATDTPAKHDHVHKLGTEVAGAGLDLVSGALVVDVDDTTIASGVDGLEVKDNAIDATKLADHAVGLAQVDPASLDSTVFSVAGLDDPTNFAAGVVDDVALEASLPRGIIDLKEQSATTAAVVVETDVPLLTMTKTPRAGSTIRVKACVNVAGEAGDMVATLRLYRGAALIKSERVYIKNAGLGHESYIERILTAVPATSAVYKVSIDKQSGGAGGDGVFCAGGATNPAWLLLEDLGS